MTILVISPDGQVVGRLIEERETIEATAEPLKALLAGYQKKGAPQSDRERHVSLAGPL